MRTVEEKIKFFFRRPNDAPDTDRESIFSTLFLLRRDVYTCFRINPNDLESKLTNEAIWPGVMGILAGVDLLAKFSKGRDEVGKVGDRFKAYIKTYMDLPSEDQETIYQLRNSLLHSFGLYSKKNKSVYRFSLNRSEETLVKQKGEQHVINIILLHQIFEESISVYHSKLEADEELQANFERMYPNYSGVEIKKI